jgi:phosphomannomutase
MQESHVMSESTPRSPIVFGTDGWRAAIADTYTFENVRIVAQATADYLAERGQAKDGLVVGYDMRFASENFAAAVAEVLAGNGIHVYLSSRAAATPAVAYSILGHHAAGAAMITASHNPWRDNGYKYKPEYAGSADPETIAAIERHADRRYADRHFAVQNLVDARQSGSVEDFDPTPDYLARLGELVDLNSLKSAGLTLVVDPMYGSGQGYFSALLSGGSTTVQEINCERNPFFGGINPEPIARNLGKLMAAVPSEGAAAGVALDGDADRVGLVDERGRYINQLQVYGLLALYLLEQRGWRGPLVKSINTTSMADRLGEKYGVPVIETPVGFKYIGPAMTKADGILGGEESGGYAIRGHIPERDGSLAGLFLLEMLLAYDVPLSAILDHLQQVAGPSYYDRLDVRFPAEARAEVMARFEGDVPSEIAGHRVDRVDTLDGYKYYLDDGSWLLVRSSGTEPLIRLYSEARSDAEVAELLEAGKQLAGLP